MRRYSTISLLTVLIFFSAQCLMALPPDELSSFETVATQSVSNNDMSAPYNVTGQSIVNIIRGMVNFDVRGASIVYNRRSGQIFVRHTPTEQLKIEDIIQNMRSVVFKQVEIEARFVTVGVTDFKGIGTDFFGGDYTTSYNGTRIGTQIPRSDSTANNFVNFDDFVNALNDTTYGGQFSAMAFGNNFDVGAFIDALESKTEVNTLSSPKLTVYNNQRAHIKIKKLQNYISEIASELRSTGEDSAPFLSLEVNVEQSQAGTILDVTPTINADGTITLDLHPTYLTVNLSNVRNVVNQTGNSTFSNPMTLPVYTKQSIDTSVTIMNGGVVVLGGLITEEEHKNFNKVPFFGDIPLLGKYLFTNEQVTDEKTYLLIFVKGKVVEPKRIP
jgi:MSHA biogenesis protein MshL